MVPRPIAKVLSENVNNKIEIEIKKSLSEKDKLNNEEKTCRHCSRHKCVKKDVFEAFYEHYIEYKNYINDILNNKFQTDKLEIFEKSRAL